MPNQPLAEVFGYPIDNQSLEAQRHREKRLCPFNNRVPNCTKDKANDPLGVCSIFDGDQIAVTCPVRFRERWIVATDAAEFFFPKEARWTSLTEIRLKDAEGKSAGNIDLVLVSYDERGKLLDYGALEIQGVYISGNVRQPFEHYMQDPANQGQMDWRRQPNYPHPDYLPSSRRRPALQLLYNGGILRTWGRRIAVALDVGLFNTLPTLRETTEEAAEMAWLIYDLVPDLAGNRYALQRVKTVYTKFSGALIQTEEPRADDEDFFLASLQDKLDEKLDGNPPDA